MIKKFLVLFFVCLFIFSLCGCNSFSVFSSDSHRYLISSLGFEENTNEIIVYAEALVINSEDMNTDKQRIIFEGKGDTCEKAFSISKSTAAENFDLSHCGIIALSNKLSPENLNEILNWCYDIAKITLSAKLIACENPRKILDLEPLSSIASGYDILSLLEKTSEIQGVNFKNSLFEILSKSELELNVFALPFILVENDKRFLSGLSIFKENLHILNLNLNQMLLYSLITDSFSKGNSNIKFAKTTYKTKDNGNFVITVSLNTSKNKEIIKNDSENFLHSSLNNYGDIFGISNIIEYQNPRLWNKSNKDLNKLRISVAIK